MSLENRALLLCAFGLSVISAAFGSSVYFVDSEAQAYLQSQPDTHLSKQLYNAVAPSLMGLRPAIRINDVLSAEINTVVRPSPLHHPRAFVSLQLLGAADATAIGGMLESFASGRKVVNFQAKDLSASDVLDSLLPLASVNPGVKFRFLSTEHLKVAPASAEGMLDAFAKSIGATYTPGTAPLSGKLQLRDDVTLDCSAPEDQAFVAELVYKVAELDHILSHSQEQQVVQLTVTGLHALAVKYGVESAQVTAATGAVVEATVAALPADAILQVTTVPVVEGDAPAIRQQLQRTLKAGEAAALPVGNSTDVDVGSTKFSTSAIAYGAFMILLYFTFAGIYCMCTMKFKRDSLLYGKSD